MIRFLGQFALVVLVLFSFSANAAREPGSLKIAMLHLELRYADLEHNAALVKAGIELAAEHGADWVITPELTFTGYRFDLAIGTEWIGTGPDQFVQSVQASADEHNLVVFLSHIEGVSNGSDGPSKRFNTLFVIDQQGDIIGRHQKINTIPISEGWSTAGDNATLIEVNGLNVGLLICADAWPPDHANWLKEQGASMIVSSASWAPGHYGPGDTWEKRSLETGLPLIVNNRTGVEREFDLREATSVVAYQGKRVLSHASDNSQLVLIDWDTTTNQLLGLTKHVVKLNQDNTNSAASLD
ncbi:MAG: carbon-nitrogen hydrolase family protein [Pseudomonadota bacterium]